jgi:trigger factor
VQSLAVFSAKKFWLVTCLIREKSYLCSPKLSGAFLVPFHTGGCGEIGRRTRLRIWRREAWGFESLHPHTLSSLLLQAFFLHTIRTNTMASVETSKVDNTSTIFKISIHKSDYLPVYEKELKTYRQRAQLKGFRPGTAPLSVVKKMYGKSLMYETVMDIMNTKLYEAMNEAKLNVLAQPELVPEQSEKMDISVDNPAEQYTMAFKVGHYTFNIAGLDHGTVLTRFKLDDMSKRAADELEALAKKSMRPEETTDKIKSGDIFYLDSKELGAGGVVKEDGYETTITVFSNGMKLTQAAEDLFYGKLAVGDSVVFNARDLEQFEGANAEKSYRRYILNLEEDDTREVGDLFSATIKNVMRMGEPVYDEAFYETNFGAEIRTKEAALEALKVRVENEYDEAFKNTLRRQAKLAIIEKNRIELPESMLETWFRRNDTRLTDDNMAENREQLLNQVRLQIITDTIADDLGAGEVSDDEVSEYFADAIREQYGFYIPDQYLAPMVRKMMANQEQTSEARFSLRHRKVMDYVIGQVKVEEKLVSEEALKGLMDEEFAKDRALFAVKY